MSSNLEFFGNDVEPSSPEYLVDLMGGSLINDMDYLIPGSSYSTITSGTIDKIIESWARKETEGYRETDNRLQQALNFFYELLLEEVLEDFESPNSMPNDNLTHNFNFFSARYIYSLFIASDKKEIKFAEEAHNTGLECVHLSESLGKGNSILASNYKLLSNIARDASKLEIVRNDQAELKKWLERANSSAQDYYDSVDAHRKGYVAMGLSKSFKVLYQIHGDTEFLVKWHFHALEHYNFVNPAKKWKTAESLSEAEKNLYKETGDKDFLFAWHKHSKEQYDGTKNNKGNVAGFIAEAEKNMYRHFESMGLMKEAKIHLKRWYDHARENYRWVKNKDPSKEAEKLSFLIEATHGMDYRFPKGNKYTPRLQEYKARKNELECPNVIS